MEAMEAVQKMQDYIHVHYKEDGFCINDVCADAGYSRRQADRLFKKYLHKTLQDYIKAVCLTEGAKKLRDTQKPIIEIAMDSHFETHEGFSRSFYKRFHIMPSEYRKQKVAIPLFIQYPVSHYSLFKHKEEPDMDKDSKFCYVTANERKRRKLIYLPSRHTQDYLSYCEEVGCEWEGLLNSIPEKMDTAALIELPECYKVMELSECFMLYFQSEPYEKEEDFGKAIESVYKAVDRFKPKVWGFEFAYDIAPSFNFGADAEVGARIAIPARSIRKTGKV